MFELVAEASQLIKKFSADGNWYQFVDPASGSGWRTSRPGSHLEHFHFVPDERLELRYQLTAVPGFAIWYEGHRVDFVAGSKELLHESLVDLARAKAIRWLGRNYPGRV